MSNNSGNRPAMPGKGEHKMMVGILVGMIIGVGIAAGLAWYWMTSPTPFLKKSPLADKLPETSAPQSTSAVAASLSDKPRFEFYTVLPDKQGVNVVAQSKSTDNPKQSVNKAAVYEALVLQAGSFQNKDEAEKRKGELALLGYEANIQSATIAEKGVWYRVRLGPYKTADEVNHARSFLQQKGIESTPMRVQ